MFKILQCNSPSLVHFFSLYFAFSVTPYMDLAACEDLVVFDPHLKISADSFHCLLGLESKPSPPTPRSSQSSFPSFFHLDHWPLPPLTKLSLLWRASHFSLHLWFSSNCPPLFPLSLPAYHYGQTDKQKGLDAPHNKPFSQKWTQFHMKITFLKGIITLYSQSPTPSNTATMTNFPNSVTRRQRVPKPDLAGIVSMPDQW